MKKLTTYRIDDKLLKALEKEAKQKKVARTAIIEMLLRVRYNIFNNI